MQRFLPMKNPLVEYRSFRHFFLSRIATTMSNQMMMVVVAWQMYELTGSAYDLGMVGLAQFLPALALALVVRQVADRYDRRRILAWCLAGAFDMVSVVIRQSLVQLDTPDVMRGRVSAVNSIFIGASNQLGEFESGVTASWFGTVPSG